MEYPAFSSGRASVREALRAHSFIRNPLGCQSQYPLCHLRTRLLPLVPKSVLTKKGECFWGMKCRNSHEIGSKAGGPQSGADHLQRRSSSGSGSISSGKGKKRASDTNRPKRRRRRVALAPPAHGTRVLKPRRTPLPERR